MKLLFLDTFKLKKRPLPLFVPFMAFLLAFTCAYCLFDAIMEADFLSGKKYEQTDVEEVYAEKQSSHEAALVSPSLFSPLPNILFDSFANSVSSSNTLFLPLFSVLRC